MRHALAVTVKELRQIRRDPRTLLILLFIPAFFLFLYGYALNFDIRHVALAVEDRDNSDESRRLISSFVDSSYFDLTTTVMASKDVDHLINARVARAVLVIPEDFSRTVREGRTAEVQVLLDGDNANTATTVLGYATAVLRDASFPTEGGADVRIASVEPRVWYNPELRSALFLVPGLVAYISMITAVVSTALSIVREKENGTMEQIRMAPISTISFIAGKTLPYLVLSQVSAFIVMLAAMALFGLPMRGDWVALGAVIAVFLVGALGTGLLVSTLADTQQVAFQLAMLIAFLPTFILSGFIYPIASMPTALQYVTAIVPARYFLIALRGIVLKGSTLASLVRPVAAMAVYATVVLSLAAARLSRR
jgi:ABC-2 type transport system permease protein